MIIFKYRSEDLPELLDRLLKVLTVFDVALFLIYARLSGVEKPALHLQVGLIDRAQKRIIERRLLALVVVPPMLGHLALRAIVEEILLIAGAFGILLSRRLLMLGRVPQRVVGSHHHLADGIGLIGLNVGQGLAVLHQGVLGQALVSIERLLLFLLQDPGVGIEEVVADLGALGKVLLFYNIKTKNIKLMFDVMP